MIQITPNSKANIYKEVVQYSSIQYKDEGQDPRAQLDFTKYFPRMMDHVDNSELRTQYYQGVKRSNERDG